MGRKTKADLEKEIMRLRGWIEEMAPCTCWSPYGIGSDSCPYDPPDSVKCWKRAILDGKEWPE